MFLESGLGGFEVSEEPLSHTSWMVRAESMSASSLVRKAMNVAESLRVIRSVMICPVCTYRAAMIETVPWRT